MDTWQQGAEVGRTRKDVLPYKSASVWCTAINLNDLSPSRACFGIQKPQPGLVAAVHLDSPLFGAALLIRTCGWGRDWLQRTHYLPLSSGLDYLPVSQSTTHHHSGAKTKKKHQGTTNSCASQLLRSHSCIHSATYGLAGHWQQGLLHFWEGNALIVWCLSHQGSRN